METTKNRLGTRLRELRKASNFTQDYVAAFLGVVRQTYSHYETGKRTPSTDSLYKLSGLYKISVEDLLHLSLLLDPDEYYDAPDPTESSLNISDYLSFMNDKGNQNKYGLLADDEKKLLFLYAQLSHKDQEELIEIAKIKLPSKKTNTK